MRDDEFEWDDEKAASNWRKHKVRFADAIGVFSDPNRIEEADDCPDEERWAVKGVVEGQVLVVVYTERNRRARIITARGASKREQAEYYDQFR